MNQTASYAKVPVATQTSHSVAVLPRDGPPVMIHVSSRPTSKARLNTPGAHSLPRGWSPSSRTARRLAGELGMSPADLLDQYLGGFRALCISRAFLYRNWNIAFRNCVRNDWLGLRK